jgi:intein/homing endonuclease
MNFKPTAEQERIFLFTKNRPENILIKARAGSGKTSTAVECVKLLPKDKSITFLAFNKHIKDELETKLPEHVRCYTTYGLGNSAIKRKYGDKIVFDEFKSDKIIQKKAKSWKLNDEFKSEEEVLIYLDNIKKLCNLCRLTLTTKADYIPFVADRYDIPLTKPNDIKRVLKVLDTMTIDRNTYDYTDMIFLPAIDNTIWFFPQDYVFVDECLPYKTYISTIDGKKQIGSLFNLNEKKRKLPNVITYNENKKIFENKKILDVWCTGEKDVYYVMLNGKRKLKSTVNHKFLTSNGWKRLDELIIGDCVLSNYYEQPYHLLLNNTQKNIVIGSKLGDGNINKISDFIYRLRVIHGKNQKEYIQWKAKFFNEEINENYNNGYSNKNAFVFCSNTFYWDNTIDYIDNISLQSLAISWMDDGNLGNSYSRLYSTAKSYDNSIKFSNKIKNNWNIESKVCTGKSSSSNKKYYWLEFNAENTRKLSFLLREYIHPSMDYKLCLEDRGYYNNDYWKINTHEIGCMVVTKEHTFHKKEKTYDMTVEDNHNFITTSTSMFKGNAENYGIITHNCQDINRCQIKIIEKVLKRNRTTKKLEGRLFSFGDETQSIYGFNAVDDKSFQWFEKFENTKVLPLTTSFRCSKAVIRKAQEIVPDIKALPDAPEGCVREGSVVDEAQSGDFVICRTTMPLVKLFFEFLVQRKKAIIKGSDIGVHLIELIGKINSVENLVSFWNDELLQYRNSLKKDGILNPNDHSGYAILEDKVNTLLFLARLSNSIVDLKFKINSIFTDEIQGIVLSTVHKVKGLEADRVFIIRPDLLPMQTPKPWQFAQEKNLEYVAITRSRLELIYDHNWKDE